MVGGVPLSYSGLYGGSVGYLGQNGVAGTGIISGAQFGDGDGDADDAGAGAGSGNAGGSVGGSTGTT